MKPTVTTAAPPTSPVLLSEVRQLIDSSRVQLATAVNSTLTLLYWNIGRRIRSEVLQGERAAYGEQIVSALARQLELEYGRGFSAKNLRHMLRFAEAIPEAQIVSSARRQLSWTHFKALIYIDDPLKRDFYLQMSQQEGWSTRTLQERIDSLLFERTALSGAVLKTVKVCLPKSGVVEQFTNAVEPILKRQDLLEQENQHLTQLRDWLLPMLMNCQVTVA